MKWMLFVFILSVVCSALPLVKNHARDAKQPPPEFDSATAMSAPNWTPLMQAASSNPDEVRRLLSRGADARARSKSGNDALLLAARRPGNSESVRLLLEAGADPNSRNDFGATALMAAVAAEDAESVNLLIAAGADVNAAPNPDLDGFLFGGGRTPLMWAAYRKNGALLRTLLDHGANVNGLAGLGTALTQAAWASDETTAAILIDAGAKVDLRDQKWNFTALHWAAASEYASPSLVSLLLRHGADVNAVGGEPVDNYLGQVQTPLMLALQRGETAITAALRRAGATETGVTPPRKATAPVVARQPDDAATMIDRALNPLMQSAVESPRLFLAHASQQNCASCHQQHVPMLAFGAARKRGFTIDPPAAASVFQGIKSFHTNDVVREAVFYPEPAIEFGYALMNMSAEGEPRSALTDELLHHLLVIQAPDGRWHHNFQRPPIESSDVTATALAVHALRLYSIPGREREIARAIERGRTWLENCRTETNEEKSYHLLGLAWAKSSSTDQQAAAARLVSDQRPDGGWGQLQHLPSDAYATGLSLYALMRSGTKAPSHESVARGIAFLQRTQTANGTWHVRRRAIPFQPPMPSGFPHGADSWISAAGTSWAVLALTMVAEGGNGPAHHATAGPTVPPAVSDSPAPVSATVDFVHDIAPALKQSCLGCHDGPKPRGNYSVTSRSSILQRGNRGESPVDFDHPQSSLLLRAMRNEIEDMEMPPLAQRHKYPPLTPEQLKKFEAWIASGAPWP